MMFTIAHSNTCENKKDFSFSGFPVGSCRKDGAQEAPPPFHSHLMQLIRLVLAKVYFSRPAFFPEQYGLLIVRACCVNISIVSLHLFSLFSFSLFLFPFFYSTVPSSFPPPQVPAGASAGGRSECWPQLYLSCHQPVCWPAINCHRGRATCFIAWT